MSIFAGIYSLNNKFQIDESHFNSIVQNISRKKSKLHSFRNEKICIVKSDIGAFKDSGFFENENSVSALAGEPYYYTKNNEYSRQTDLLKISNNFDNNFKEILSACRGTFSICYYDKRKDNLILATDLLGIRPLYYYYNEQFLVFSNVLRILETLDLVPKVPDLVSITEKALLGYIIGNKSPYKEIKILRSGQLLQLIPKGVEAKYYFRLNEINTSNIDSEDSFKEVYSIFSNSISLRSKGNNLSISFLSGGLDSRVIVSELKKQRKKIFTVSISKENDQDRFFAQLFAKQIGSNHYFIKRPDENWTWWGEMQKILDSAKFRAEYSERKPTSVFSGDGGSVLLGAVYLTSTILSNMRYSKIDLVLSEYLDNHNISKNLYKKNIYRNLNAQVNKNIINELSSEESDDPGKDFYIFLLKNDQSRHLHDYYENIDLAGIEYHLPFFDGKLVKKILSLKVDDLLYHKFYHEWIKFFPKETMSIPWQTYPGHLKCPIKPEDKYKTQWQRPSNKELFAQNKILLKNVKNIIFKSNFPSKIMNRYIVLIAVILQYLRIKNSSSLLKYVYEYYKINSKL